MVVGVLLEHGALMSFTTTSHETALLLAQKHGHKAVQSMLQVDADAETACIGLWPAPALCVIANFK